MKGWCFKIWLLMLFLPIVGWGANHAPGNDQKGKEKKTIPRSDSSKRAIDEAIFLVMAETSDNLINKVADASNDSIKRVYFDRADMLLKRILTKYPLSVSCWINLGNLHYQMDDLPAAEEIYLKVLTTHPSNSNALFKLSIVNRDLQRFEKAIYYIEDYHKIRVDKLDVYLDNLAEIYYRWGKHAGKDHGNLEMEIEKISIAIGRNTRAGC